MFTVPVGEWFRAGKHDWLRGVLQDSPLVARLFRREVIDRMLQQHRSGDANFTRELRALAAVALWAATEGQE